MLISLEPLSLIHICVLLATGGYCGLYKHSLNTPDVCGVGHSAALDAGASLINLEFMQFIPGLTAPRYQTLFNEYSLIHVTDSENDTGQDILRPYLPPDVSMACLLYTSTEGKVNCQTKIYRNFSVFFDMKVRYFAIRSNNW